MNKLIEKAKYKKRHARVFTKEEMELAESFIKGEIDFAGIPFALGEKMNKNGVYCFVARALRQKFSKEKHYK